MKIGEVCGGSANKCGSPDNRHAVDSTIQQLPGEVLKKALTPESIR